MEWSTTFTVSGRATLMTGPCLSDPVACLPTLYRRGKPATREEAQVSPFEWLPAYVGDTAFLFMSIVVLLLCPLEYILQSLTECCFGSPLKREFVQL